MRPLSLLSLLVIAASTLHAEPAPPAKAPSAEAPAADTLSQYKTADELWSHFEKLKAGPAQKLTSREAAAVYFKSVDAAAEGFVQRYPKDPRRWEAKLIHTQITPMIAQTNGEPPDLKKATAGLQEIADASDAPSDMKAEARFGLLQIRFEGVEDPTSLPADIDAEIVAFLKDFPKSPHVGPLQFTRVKAMEKNDPAKAEAMLRDLAKSPNEQLAQSAQGELKMLDLQKKPLDLKFTAVDGKAVDVANLRGKVVLIDFWATWCQPCMMELPKVLALYKKHHAAGLEIVGISLDQDKDKLLSVTKEKGMTWPQYFDGKGFENSISSGYGIDSIPRLWLINKKGFVVNVNVDRDSLDAETTKLLAE